MINFNQAGKLRMALKGGKWKSKIKFYDYDREDGNPNEICMEEVANFIESRSFHLARIVRARLCKVPLPVVLGPLGKNAAVMIHVFVVFQTEDGSSTNRWHSIEKYPDNIVVQHGQNSNDPERRLLGHKRRKPVRILQEEDGQAGVSIATLLKYLVCADALNNAYNLLARNCQHFAADVFHLITGLPATDALSSFVKQYTSL